MNRKFQLEQMLKAEPQNEFLLFAIAKENEAENNPKMAIEKLELLKKINPNYTGLYYHLAALYKNNNEPHLAKLTLQEGIEICTTNSELHDLSELRSALMNLEIETLEN